MCLPPYGHIRFDKGVDTTTFLSDRMDWVTQICLDPSNIDDVDLCSSSICPYIHGMRIIDSVAISEEPMVVLGVESENALARAGAGSEVPPVVRHSASTQSLSPGTLL